MSSLLYFRVLMQWRSNNHAGAWVKIMWKAKVKDQELACVMQVSCGREVSVQVRVNEWYLWLKMLSEAIAEYII